MPWISVDFDETVGRVSPRIYGAGFEHLGAGVYGGFWTGQPTGGQVTAAPAVTAQGWREDVLALAKALRPGVLRWPGGSFAQHYHWRDGIGQRSERPQRFDYFWAKPEPNLVGTDEFLDLCEAIGAEPVITVNTRTGTPEEAAAWVEYCNGAAETPGGQQRTVNGHPEPYKVRLWAVGSQSWELGVEDAAHRHRAFAAAMRVVDPTIELVGIGGNPTNQAAWDREMLRLAGWNLDVLGIWTFDGVSTSGIPDVADAHYANSASAERILAAFSGATGAMDEVAADRPTLRAGLDAWGIWRISRQGLQHDYHISDALVAAAVLHGLQRQGDRAGLACWGNLVNALGLIQATERSAWTTPAYEVFKLFRHQHGDEAVRCWVGGPTMEAPAGSAPVRSPRLPQPYMELLTASATRDRARGRYTLSVVNRSYQERQDVEFTFTGLPDGIGATVYTLADDDPFAGNSLADPRRLIPTEIPIGQIASSWSFPPCSLTVFVWEETPGLA